ncbi:MAG: hypothetical protein WBY61_08020, partial [Terriglobales bacterium]
ASHESILEEQWYRGKIGSAFARLGSAFVTFPAIAKSVANLLVPERHHGIDLDSVAEAMRIILSAHGQSMSGTEQGNRTPKNNLPTASDPK